MRRREVEPEWLDQLPANAPEAIRSRRDLRRINALMGNAALIATASRQAWKGAPPRSIVDLGAGDGAFLAAVAGRLWRDWPKVTATLVDRVATTAPGIRGEWRVECVCADAAVWLKERSPAAVDLVIANLFLHHFTDAELREILSACARVARVFVACEPERSRRALLACGLLGFIGCNRVTRHDARVSVRAGFAGGELTALWPTGAGWHVEERAAGLFSHLFVARRRV